MARVAKEYPRDVEATIFYALALAQTAPPSDKTYKNQLAAGALLILLLLALVLPRFVVLSSDRCWLYGGVWLRYTNSYNDACVFQTGW